MTSEQTARKGDWQQTYTGRQAWPLDMRAGDFDIADIAHSLALQCRFGGHCRTFYSVAEHCVRVSWYVEAMGGNVPAALGHDSPETYIVDVPRPLKRQLEGYAEIEHGIARLMEAWMGLDDGAFDRPVVKYADEVLLATEARDLMKIGKPWHLRALPLPGRIRPWGWRQAEVRFLARYHALRGEHGWWRTALRERPELAWGFLAWGVDAVCAVLCG